MTARPVGWRARAASLVAVLVLAGCGGDATPADEVPQLATRLDRVDQALVDGEYSTARRELDALVEATVEARDDGTLEAEEANRILAAAAHLLSAFPDPPPARSEETPTEPVIPPEDDEEEGDEDGGHEDRSNGKGNGDKGKGHDGDKDD